MSAVEVIKTVSSACVCLSVCWHSHGWTIWHIIKKFGIAIDLDDILDELDGQGHGSKMKSPVVKNVISKLSRSECQDTKHWFQLCSCAESQHVREFIYRFGMREDQQHSIVFLSRHFSPIHVTTVMLYFMGDKYQSWEWHTGIPCIYIHA